MTTNFSNTNGSTTSSSTSMPNAPDIITYSVRLPKNVEKNFNVMKFSGNLGVDFSKWTKVEMTRENNSKEFKEGTKEIPEFGAGSEYGRKEREEARRLKFGMNRKYNYQANNQPWILKSHSDCTKNYKGKREGGVGENAAYYVLTHGDNGTLEAYPLKEWYNFQSIQRYKPLTSEEAEEQYSKRSKCVNYFSIMVKNRLKNDTEDAKEEENKENKTKNKKSTEFQLSEMDEWISSSNESSDEEGAKNNHNSDEDVKSRKKKTKNANNKKKAKHNTSDVEALEDSDDGDEEGRECEYISSSSESEPDYNLHSVSEEKGLKTILNSDEDDSEDEENEKKAEENIEQKLEKSKKDSDFSSDSDTSENTKVQQSNKKINKKSGKELITQLCKTVQNSNSSLKRKQDSMLEEPNKKLKMGSSVRNLPLTVQNQNSSLKRKQDSIIDEPNKKLKMGSSVRNLPLAGIGITEEVIRKYLKRKPMSSVELISKFKLKRLNNDERKQAEAIIVSILKKIKPNHEIVNGKIQFSL